MDDDGRSGRWMAGGIMGKLTHLQAFCSDDAKRGRVWITADGTRNRRAGITLEYLLHPDKDDWRIERGQVAAMEGFVTWADEPKTLTPQEAFSALSDGLCLSQFNMLYESSVIKLDAEHGLVCWTRDYHDDVGYRGSWFWDTTSISGVVGYRIVPDPSQPAEPPLKVGDRVRFTVYGKKELYGSVTRNEDAGRAEVLWDGDNKPLTMTLTSAIERVNDPFVGEIRTSDIGGFLDALERIEAEPQVEYPPMCQEAQAAIELLVSHGYRADEVVAAMKRLEAKEGK